MAIEVTLLDDDLRNRLALALQEVERLTNQNAELWFYLKKYHRHSTLFKFERVNQMLKEQEK